MTDILGSVFTLIRNIHGRSTIMHRLWNVCKLVDASPRHGLAFSIAQMPASRDKDARTHARRTQTAHGNRWLPITPAETTTTTSTLACYELLLCYEPLKEAIQWNWSKGCVVCLTKSTRTHFDRRCDLMCPFRRVNGMNERCVKLCKHMFSWIEWNRCWRRKKEPVVVIWKWTVSFNMGYFNQNLMKSQ